MARKKSNVNSSEPQRIDFSELACEIEDVKRLLILLLAKLGSDSKEIARVLRVGDSTIRAMISFRKIKRVCMYGNDKAK